MNNPLRDGDGNISSMRVCLVLCVLAVIGVFLVSNIIMWIKVLTTPNAVLTILDFQPQMVWILAIGFGGKVAQSFTENLSSPPLSNTPLIKEVK